MNGNDEHIQATTISIFNTTLYLTEKLISTDECLKQHCQG